MIVGDAARNASKSWQWRCAWSVHSAVSVPAAFPAYTSASEYPTISVRAGEAPRAVERGA